MAGVCVWQWACMGACVAGGHVWQGGIHGGGCAWQGACVAGEYAWQGACVAGECAWQEVRPFLGQNSFIAGSLEAAYSLNWGAREIWGKGGGETLTLL